MFELRQLKYALGRQRGEPRQLEPSLASTTRKPVSPCTGSRLPPLKVDSRSACRPRKSVHARLTAAIFFSHSFSIGPSSSNPIDCISAISSVFNGQVHPPPRRRPSLDDPLQPGRPHIPQAIVKPSGRHSKVSCSRRVRISRSAGESLGARIDEVSRTVCPRTNKGATDASERSSYHAVQST